MADPTESAETDPEGSQPERKNWRRELEERAEKAEAQAKEAETRATDLERKIAFADAGLSGLSDKQKRALEATHEGDFTAEGLKATAEELGFGSKTEEVETETQDPGAATEAAELAKLAKSPSSSASPDAPIRTQEAFDAKVRSFDSEADLDAFLQENIDLLPYA